jgi:hypothetical protein
MVETPYDYSVVVGKRSDDKLEVGVIPERSGRTEGAVECGKGGVSVRTTLETRLQVISGDESPHAPRVDRKPMVTAKPYGQVLELDIIQSPTTLEERLQLASVEVSWFG